MGGESSKLNSDKDGNWQLVEEAGPDGLAREMQMDKGHPQFGETRKRPIKENQPEN